MSHIVTLLDATCWTGKINNIVNIYSFNLYPTFYTRAGIFKIKYYFKDCIREQDAIFNYVNDNSISIQSKFGNYVYTAIIDTTREEKIVELVWNSPNGYMTWYITRCPILSTPNTFMEILK
jgi:hypothetical protein